MVEAYVVIGANYGDEGKGLVTDYLCRRALFENKTVVNVLTNGGCQRGHTVEDKNGKRHIFSHLGAGYLHCDSYFSPYYMVNPMVFMEEYGEYKVNHRVYIDKDCTITTPYDMMLNRMIENRRGESRHGSCGYGIWETVKRNKVFPLIWEDLPTDKEVFQDVLLLLRKVYFEPEIEKYGIEMTEDEKEMFYSDILVENFTEDTYRMRNCTIQTTFEKVSGLFDVAVFENAQGLLLDKDTDRNGTPTKTGTEYAREMMKHTGVSLSPYYVSRTYLTKHGAGNFPGECKKEDICEWMEDLTNHPNAYQGTLRYGMFNEERVRSLLNRIEKDAKGLDYRLVITHTNEYECEPLLKYADFVSDNPRNIEEKEKGRDLEC